MEDVSNAELNFVKIEMASIVLIVVNIHVSDFNDWIKDIKKDIQ